MKKKISLGTAVISYRDYNKNVGIIVKRNNKGYYNIKWLAFRHHYKSWWWYPEEYIKENYVII